jgi:hypothetical protein
MSWFFPPTIGGIPSLLDTLLKTWQGNEMLELSDISQMVLFAGL